MVKMKKLGKKRALAASWEGPYRFVGHVDGKGTLTLKKVVVCVLCRMQMGVSGRDLGGTYKFSTCSQIEQS
jgi:hypothetical protein